jgi:DNA-directed RNA polymerase specialized sigma24 family protein
MIDRNLPFDMAVWYPDVVKIVAYKYRTKVGRCELEDLTQEVCVALQHKNLEGSGSAYNKDLSSPSHYIFMVANGVYVNTYKKNKFNTSAESLDELLETAPKVMENHQCQGDAALEMKTKLEGFESYLTTHDPELFDHYVAVRSGYSLSEIGRNNGKNMNYIKEKLMSAIDDWKNEIKNFGVKSVDGMVIEVKHWMDESNRLISE